MICPYNNFKECVKNDCPAWRHFTDPMDKGYYITTCAIAFNGGVPNNERVQREEEQS